MAVIIFKHIEVIKHSWIIKKRGIRNSWNNKNSYLIWIKVAF